MAKAKRKGQVREENHVLPEEKKKKKANELRYIQTKL